MYESQVYSHEAIVVLNKYGIVYFPLKKLIIYITRNSNIIAIIHCTSLPTDSL